MYEMTREMSLELTCCSYMRTQIVLSISLFFRLSNLRNLMVLMVSSNPLKLVYKNLQQQESDLCFVDLFSLDELHFSVDLTPRPAKHQQCNSVLYRLMISVWVSERFK